MFELEGVQRPKKASVQLKALQKATLQGDIFKHGLEFMATSGGKLSVRADEHVCRECADYIGSSFI